MSTIQWNPDKQILAGTTLRDHTKAENNNMALHVGGNLTQVIENRKALSDTLGIDIKQWVFCQQTHSDHLHEATSNDMGKGSIQYIDGIADCDALYTKETNLAIGVFHADCVPVLLYDPYTNIICAIHSGWQGTVKEITRKSLSYLVTHEGVNPSHVQAYIGPAIAFHSFEVGQEVIDQVNAMSFDTSPYIIYHENGKASVDNKGLNYQMLLDLGVPKEQIRINPNDTFLNNDAFFSYRRDHACGRHLSYILRTPNNE
ncbi:MAG: peptidoglycan editing factor PgeF [Longicatena sp.]